MIVSPGTLGGGPDREGAGITKERGRGTDGKEARNDSTTFTPKEGTVAQQRKSDLLRIIQRIA